MTTYTLTIPARTVELTLPQYIGNNLPLGKTVHRNIECDFICSVAAVKDRIQHRRRVHLH